MPFLETRFPLDIAFGSGFGPMFSTDIVTNRGGFEKRNQNWQIPLIKADVSHAVRQANQMAAVLALFYAAAGMANGFRVKDVTDYQATATVAADGSQGVIITGKMYKAYTVAGVTCFRRVWKPVTGTITGATVSDYTLGLASGSTWSGEYDVPMRFDTDLSQYSAADFNAFTWQSIVLQELRDPTL